jgi:hypothetical protein
VTCRSKKILIRISEIGGDGEFFGCPGSKIGRVRGMNWARVWRFAAAGWSLGPSKPRNLDLGERRQPAKQRPWAFLGRISD